MKPVLLASTSPRRREILATTGLEFEVVASEYEEDNTLDLPPAELVMHLAAGKAAWVAERHPDAVVIAADTLVILDGQVFGKPSGPAEVKSMITALSGRWHSVFTGLVIIRGARRVTDFTETRVHLRELTPAEINQYSELTEPLDKAGAYGIQTTAGLFIDQIEGDYYGMVGLSLSLLAVHLAEFDIDLLAGVSSST